MYPDSTVILSYAQREDRSSRMYSFEMKTRVVWVLLKFSICLLCFFFCLFRQFSVTFPKTITGYRNHNASMPSGFVFPFLCAASASSSPGIAAVTVIFLRKVADRIGITRLVYWELMLVIFTALLLFSSPIAERRTWTGLKTNQK